MTKSSFLSKTILRTSVTDFDENNVIIIGDPAKTAFKLQAAIHFTPFDENDVNEGGHYVVWRRKIKGEGWLVISDKNYHYEKDFNKSLTGFYLLFLEKKTISDHPFKQIKQFRK